MSGMLFGEARASSYKYEPAIVEKYEHSKPILSIILSCYYRVDLIQQAVQSVLDQNYKNIELILVDNAAHSDVKKYLINFHKKSANVSLITFDVNQFEWNDVCKEVAVCWNVALLHCRGDYVCHLGYDDVISPSYASRMVCLFLENPDCVTAAPMPYSINSIGEIDSSSWMRDRNLRDRYKDGANIAFDLIEGNPRKLFAAPGEIFVIRRDVLLNYGGYDRIVDISQVLKYAILGVSGFDPEAALYWRHHDAQLNKQAKRRGVIFYSSSLKGWSDSGIVELWRARFGANKVPALLDYRKKSLQGGVLTVVRENVRQKNYVGTALSIGNVMIECPTLFPRVFFAIAREFYFISIEKAGRWVRRSTKSCQGSSGE